jgi:maltose-binding protein MalE
MNRLLAVAAAVVFSATALSSAAPPVAAAKVLDTRTAKLTIWHQYVAGSAEEWAFDKVLASVRPKFPNVTFTVARQEWGEVYARFEADPVHGPDLFIVGNDRIAKESKAGLLRNVTAALKLRIPNLTAAARVGAQVSGTYYMIPESSKAVALVVRDSRVPVVPATTDELLSAVQGGLKLGFVTDGYFPAGFDSGFGGRIIDSSYLCIADRTPGVADAFAYLRQLVLAGASAYTQADYGTMQRDFTGGRLDAVIDGSWIGEDYRKALGTDMSAALLPSGPAGRSRPYVAEDGWFINAKRPNGSLATKVALALTDAAAQATMMASATHVPTNAAVAVTDPIAADFAAAVANGKPMPLGTAFEAGWVPFTNAVVDVVMKGADATASVRTACSAMNAANGR